MNTEANSGMPLKLATDPPVSEKQRRAMEAAAHGHSTLGIPKSVGKEFVGDDLPRAAGVALRRPGGDMLFLKRSVKGDHAGTWGFPGGMAEGQEDPTAAAIRELSEEIGLRLQQPLRVTLDQKKNGVDFTTFLHDHDRDFTPVLNDEHDEYVWANPRNPPQPLHPGVADTLAGFDPDAVYAADEKMAFDDASVRSIDANGLLHVSKTNISKANICPYVGREIPNCESLGLDPNRIYRLLRDPAELKKAAPTFNNLPVLSKHVPISSANPQSDLIIGSTGTDASFDDPYLSNSLVIWVKKAIEDIENETKKELSSAYRYRADMTPGTYKGAQYDGVMRDIVGNHVAVVEEGRAGDDVVVGDSKETITKHQQETARMKTKLGRKATLAQGALAVFLTPRLAQDAQLPDLAKLLEGVKPSNYAERKPAIIAGVTEAVKGKLAQDASLDDMHGFLNSLDKQEPVEDADDPLPVETKTDDDEDEDKADQSKPALDAEGIKNFFKEKGVGEDVMKAFDAYLAGDEPPPFEGKPKDPAQDEDDDKDEDKVDKPAMDAAIKAAVDGVKQTQKEIRDAERAVRPYVGEIAIACDSAEQVYRAALDIMGVKGMDKVHASALPTILAMQPKPGSKKQDTTIAMDAASVDDFNKRFPHAARIGHV